MKYISFLSLFLIFSILFTVSVSALDEPSSSSDVSSDVPLKNGIFQDEDGEIRFYVDGNPTYAGLVFHNGYYYYFGSDLKAARNVMRYISLHNDLLPYGQYQFDEFGHMVDVPEVEMNDLFYLERIYILLFIIVAFTVAGLFIARPRRWI